MFIPITMISIGGLWKKNPPKTINYIYGYRTTRSMKNEATWEFAHKYVGKLWFDFGSAMTIVTVILMILLKRNNKDTIEWIVTVWSLSQCVIMCFPIVLTEKALKRNFDENGDPKN